MLPDRASRLENGRFTRNFPRYSRWPLRSFGGAFAPVLPRHGMLRALFLAVFIGVGIVASFFNRFAALLMYVWYAVFNPQYWVFWVNISEHRPSLLLGLVLIVPSLATGKFPNLTHPLSIGAAAFLALGFLAT